MTEEKLNLHQKILKIAYMAGALQRTKSGFGYKYVPEEDIQAKVTAGLQKYGVMLYNYIVPGTLNVIPCHYEKYDKKEKTTIPVNEIIVHAEVMYKWVNVENPDEYIETPWAYVGQMEDAAQAFGASATYGNRYYLMKQLQLATTESDPDNYRGKQRQAEDFEEQETERKAKEELEKAIKSVVEAGSELIKQGFDKTVIRDTVAKINNGNGNPSGIESVEMAEAVIAEFKKLSEDKKKTTVKKEKKEKVAE